MITTRFPPTTLAPSSDVAAQLQTQRSFFGICWHHPVANDPSATAEH